MHARTVDVGVDIGAGRGLFCDPGDEEDCDAGGLCGILVWEGCG